MAYRLSRLPTITVGPGASVKYEVGIDQCPTSLEDAIHDAQRLWKDIAESAMRMVMVETLLTEEERAEESTIPSTNGVTGNPDTSKTAAKVPALPLAILKASRVPKVSLRVLDTAIPRDRKPLMTAQNWCREDSERPNDTTKGFWL